MTDQEIFDKVWAHFSAPGAVRSALGGGGTCYYRTPGGAKCAAGVLIPDELYSPAMEGGNVVRLRTRWGNVLPWGVCQDWLVSALQRAHDGASDVPETLSAFRLVAKDFNLTVPEEA